ncbi:hypothetical protein SAMN02787073_4760 [Chryseobacterium vrystaatense]|uniref:Uncharacterized protein n=1 Tax=Chryseobacterium vrystaatense TaxID=307480 RepID=A0A1M5M9J1_9FLAO|nr:hypothetical protein SAMN02787073_4760 [Chryseobacterium vrystaatense]
MVLFVIVSIGIITQRLYPFLSATQNQLLITSVICLSMLLIMLLIDGKNTQ